MPNGPAVRDGMGQTQGVNLACFMHRGPPEIIAALGAYCRQGKWCTLASMLLTSLAGPQQTGEGKRSPSPNRRGIRRKGYVA